MNELLRILLPIVLGLPGLILWTACLISLCFAGMTLTVPELNHSLTIGETLLTFLGAFVGLFMVSDCEIKWKYGRPGIPLKRVGRMIAIAFAAQIILVLACCVVFAGLQDRNPQHHWIKMGVGSILAAVSLGLHLLAFFRRAAWRREYRRSLPSQAPEIGSTETHDRD